MGKEFEFKMAIRNFLISGLSGTGKTTVCEELIKRGYVAVDADTTFAYLEKPKSYTDSGEMIPEAWNWNAEKLNTLLDDKDDEHLYICGGATNETLFFDKFEKVIKLLVDDDTMKHRLLTRENSYEKRLDELNQQLYYNQTELQHAKQQGFPIIDATMPLNDVVDRVLKITND